MPKVIRSTVYRECFGQIDKAAETIAHQNSLCLIAHGGKHDGYCETCPYSKNLWPCDDPGTVLDHLMSEVIVDGR